MSKNSTGEEEFPLRDQYPNLPLINISDLSQEYSDVQIVDVRSNLEFDTIHISKAVNLPLSSVHYLKKLRHLRDRYPDDKIVLYCNGHSCAKTYIATESALSANVSEVYAFDAGIFDWANENPARTTLLGETPADISKIISKSEFISVTKDYASLLSTSAKENVLVIDIRDSLQRSFIPPFHDLEHIPLHLLRVKLINGRLRKKQLIFLDAVGKQVKWLQYYLKQFGYTNYSFLKGGVASIPRE